MYSQKVVVRNPSGLHARPASTFVGAAKGYESEIEVAGRQDGQWRRVSAKSVILLLTLGVGQGDEVELIAEGRDEERAVRELAALIETGFGEL